MVARSATVAMTMARPAPPKHAPAQVGEEVETVHQPHVPVGTDAHQAAHQQAVGGGTLVQRLGWRSEPPGSLFAGHAFPGRAGLRGPVNGAAGARGAVGGQRPKYCFFRHTHEGRGFACGGVRMQEVARAP